MEQGSHNELMSTGGIYSKLYNAQFNAAEPVTGCTAANPTG